MKQISLNQFRCLDPITQVAYAVKKKLTFYEFYGIRPLLRGWQSLNAGKTYCPLCKKEQELVSVGMMNKTYRNEPVGYARCKYCLIKLPLSKINERILNYKPRKNIHREQTRLTGFFN